MSRKPTAGQNNGDRLRVLIVAPALPIVGGQTVQAATLLESFRSEPGLTVDLLPINPQFFPRIQKIKYVRTVLTSTRYLFDLLKRTRNYDIIHIFSASYFSFLLAPTPAVLIAKMFGKKTILNYHSGEASDHLRRWGRTAIPTVRLFDRVVTPSNYLVDEFARFGLEAEPIFNSVDAGRFRFRNRTPLRPVFFSNRNFEPHYNVACTLRAFSVIQRQMPEAELIVAGDGPERSMLIRLAADLNLRNVSFLGQVSPEEMSSIYDRTDVYLNSSEIDNMPLSLIEAMVCGLPVVSTNAGGIPYIVENGRTGLLVETNNHEALAAAALSLFEDRDMVERIVNSAREDIAKYSWENVRIEWLRTYHELSQPASIQNASVPDPDRAEPTEC